MIKVKFFFPETILESLHESNPHYQERNLAAISIDKKVSNKIVSIPCVPTKDMRVDLASFADELEFTEIERDHAEDQIAYFIHHIHIKQDHLELWLYLYEFGDNS